jgi:hypothetical protein
MTEAKLKAEKACDAVIGMSVASASDLCREEGLSLRVTMVDGVHRVVTMDLKFNRVNVHVVSGEITKATVG